MVWPGGTIHTIRAIAIVQRDADGVALRMLGTNWDITRQKQADEQSAALREEVLQLELEKTNDMHRLILDAVGEGVYGLDSNGLTTFVNPAAQTMLGYTAGELIGKRQHPMIHHSHPDGSSYPVEECPIYQALSDGRVFQCDTDVFWRKDGTSFPMSFTSTPIMRNGKTDGAVVVFQEISERKRREAADASNLAKSEFLANMSHEIRTPLNGMIGMTDMVLDTDLTREQRDCLETAKQSADALLTVINDILDFSKIEAGKLDLESIDFSLRNCAETALKLFTQQAADKGLELLCDIAPEVPDRVMGDPGRLRQILLNLISNALKFTSHGEVGLRMRVESTNQAATLVRFVVTDTGIGIPAEKQESIFSPFRQADSSTTRRYGGTGLGLTISLRLVSLMGGELSVESEIGSGSKFSFTAKFELAEKTAALDGAMERDALAGIKILVVDDNRTNRRILKKILEGRQAQVVSAESGPEALQLLAHASQMHESYQVVVTDMHMPEMDGFDLVEQIRGNPVTAAIAVLMLSSGGHSADKQRCRDLRIASYLQKPVRREELLSAILSAAGRLPVAAGSSLASEPGIPLPRRQLKLLLAEDNRVNQAVAMGLLSKLGHTLVVAGNGKEALSLLERQHFDLVFMDIQMPEMDGIAATEKIREGERATHLHIPIIAMTAHAMKGDRERCIDAGMDGYISKPISFSELEIAIEAAMQRSDRRQDARSSIEKDTGMAVPIPPLWNRAEVLQSLGGDESLLRQVLDIFVEEAPKHLAALRVAIRERSAVTAEKHAHTLKGEVGYFKVPAISEKAAQLEAACRGCEFDSAQNTLPEFEAAMHRLIDSVLSCIQSGTGSST